VSSPHDSTAAFFTHGRPSLRRLESFEIACYHPIMSTETEELIRICEALPENKRLEVADFARFLLARQDDERWEQLIASSKRRPRLDDFLRASASEPASPLDPGHL
jgi:hypothetical protein